jgi:hypothetical protein
MRGLRELAATTNDPEALHVALDRFGKMTVTLANVAITQALREEEARSEGAGAQ